MTNNINPSSVRRATHTNCLNHAEILEHSGGYKARIETMEYFRSVKKLPPRRLKFT